MNESNAVYHLAWGETLPPGHYVLKERAANDGGLADLAGASPVAAGQADAVLASFDVSDGGANAVNPSNLGVVFPGDGDGVERAVEINSGAASAYRFVAMSDAAYQLQTQYNGASVNVSVIGAGFTRTYNRSDDRGLSNSLVFLKAGVYLLQFSNPESVRQTIDFLIKQQTKTESLLMNGLGQGPALNLRLVNATSASLPSTTFSSEYGPSAPTPAYGPHGPALPGGLISNTGVTSTDTPVATSPGTTGVNGVTTTGSNGSATTGVNGASTGGVYVSLGNTLVGRPSTESEHVSVVGPTGSNGSTALASSGQGLLPGIDYGRGSSGGVANPDKSAQDGDASGPDQAQAPVNGAIAANEDPVVATADQEMIASADLVSNMAARLARMVASLTGRPAETDLLDDGPGKITLDRDDSTKAERVEQAQLGSPLIFGAATVMAFQYYPPLRGLIFRKRKQESGRKATMAAGYRGPHRRA